MEENKLIIFTKNPKIGEVKTRIAQTTGQPKALKIYNELLDHTRYLSERVDAKRIVYYSDELSLSDEWTYHSFEKNIQTGSNLGVRMFNAFKDQLSHSAKAVLIGSDCLQITHKIIKEAFDQLDHSDVVIGPSNDGGYYLIGMKKLHESLFVDMPWSQTNLFEVTKDKITAQNIKLKTLEKLSDIDHEVDWDTQKQLTDNLKYTYHVMTKELWESQRALDYFTAASLETEGFIHCCFKDQFDHVLGNYFKPNADLVLLKLDRKAIGEKLVLEQSSNNDFFPHIYGHIMKTWVIDEKQIRNN